jgi:hypothetical protein
MENGNQVIGEDSVYKNTPKLLLVRVIDYNCKMNKE